MNHRKDTIVFINRFPTSVVLAEALGINRFGEAGYRLVGIDMSAFYCPETYEAYGSGKKGYVFDADWIRRCKTKSEAIEIIKNYSECAWFSVLHRTFTQSSDEA